MKESTKINISIVVGTLVSGITGVLCLRKLPNDRDVDYSKTFHSFEQTTDNIKSFSLAFAVESITVSLATVVGIAGFIGTRKVLDWLQDSSPNTDKSSVKSENNEMVSLNWGFQINDRRMVEKQAKVGRLPEM